MSLREELANEVALDLWRHEQELYVAAMAYSLDHAPRCNHAACVRHAFWQCSLPRTSGFPRDEIRCDEHKLEEAREIPGSQTVRQILARLRRV